jgi:hypothetical protein
MVYLRFINFISNVPNCRKTWWKKRFTLTGVGAGWGIFIGYLEGNNEKQGYSALVTLVNNVPYTTSKQEKRPKGREVRAVFLQKHGLMDFSSTARNQGLFGGR